MRASWRPPTCARADDGVDDADLAQQAGDVLTRASTAVVNAGHGVVRALGGPDAHRLCVTAAAYLADAFPEATRPPPSSTPRWRAREASSVGA